MAEELPLIEIVTKIFDDNLDPSRKVMERLWFRNILYEMGEQYIEWLVSANTFRRKPQNPYIPTPVSNIIRDYVRSMKAMILNKDYNIRVWPNSDDLEDKKAAKIGGVLLDHMDAADDEAFAEEVEDVALLVIVCGTAFMRTFPEKEGGEWGFDKAGKIIKTGDVGDEALLPFNVFPDVLGKNLKQKRWIGIQSLKDKEWVEDTFKEKVVDSDTTKIDYQKRLMKLVSEVSPWKGAGFDSNLFNAEAEDLVTFKEVEFRPTKKHPDGRYIVAVGDKILLENNQLPIKPVKGHWDYTLTDFHYAKVSGRFWSDSGINDLISPQNSINAIDQAHEMNRRGVGRPIITVPSDMTITRENKFGQSMLVLAYDALLSSGQSPKIEHGTPLPAQVLEERKNHAETAQNAAGDPKHVLRGKAPSSQASGVLVDILRESAEQAHLPDVKRFYRSLKRVYKKRIILAQTMFTENRMLKVKGKGDRIEIRQFKSSDLRKNTDVRLELSPKASSTNAGQASMMSEMSKSGVFGDISQQPEIRHEMMQKVGLTKFKDASNVHLEKAEEENYIVSVAKDTDVQVEKFDAAEGLAGVFSIDGIFTNWVNPKTGKDVVFGNDPTFKIHDHALHISSHTEFVLSPEFREVLAAAQVVMINHLDTHNKALQMQQAQAMKKMAMQKQLEQGGKEAGQEPKPKKPALSVA